MNLIFLFLFATISFTHGELFLGRFVVPVDHFRPQDGRTAAFHYTVNLEFYEENGPMIFFLSGGGSLTTEWIEAGLMTDLAMELGGALLTTDFRFHRRNFPTQTATVADFQHLTIDQDLADISILIHTAREHLGNANGKVFTFGVGLGGVLAVLARRNYPHLIHGAWSTNGHFRRDVFTTEIYETIADNIREYGSYECGERVTQAFRQIDEFIAAGDDETLVQQFGICRPFNIDSPYFTTPIQLIPQSLPAVHTIRTREDLKFQHRSRMDVAMFSEGVVEQIHLFIRKYHQSGLTSFCESMSVILSDPMRSLSRWVRFHYDADVGTCQNYDYEARIQVLSNTQWNSPGTLSGRRQFLYLQCTQYGILQTNTNGGMFGNRITEEYRQRLCMDAFGDGYNFDELYRAVEYSHVGHGGQNPKATRVIYTTGILDPMVSHGITYTYEEDAY